MSWSKAPTSCTPSGSPLAAAPNGSVTHGTPNRVQARLKTGSPVEASEAGAALGRRRREQKVELAQLVGEPPPARARDAAHFVVVLPRHAPASFRGAAAALALICSGNCAYSQASARADS